MKKHYVTHVEDTDKLISVAGPILEYKSWYEQYRKLMEEQAQRKYGLYTPTSEGDDDDFPSIPGMIARYSASGLTNEQMAANPVWVDKTGNGHDLQMKNFAWKGMSGVGGYEMNLNLWGNNVSDIPDISMSTTTTSVSVSVGNSTHNNNLIYIHINNWDINKNHWLKVTSTYEDGDLAFVFYNNNNNNTKKIGLPANGYVNILAYPEFKGSYAYISTTSNKQGSFTIEQLPLYPGALVFDGVDDYGVCDNFPILTKEKGYTVVALRQWITRGERALGLVSNVKNWLKDGAFLLEYRNIQADHLNKPISFGAIGSENDLPHILTYQTSKSYNGVSITTGNFEGTDVLHVGKLAPTNVGTCINAAIWELVFLDHDATEEELTKIKDYFVKTYPWLFFDQAWTVVGKTNEDEDRATIANITGNGNNLVLSNFGFAEGSGYNEEGEYAGYLVTDGVDDSGRAVGLTISKDFTLVGEWILFSKTSVNAGLSIHPQIHIFNRSEVIQILFRTAGKTLPVKSLKAICSDGRCYDENWSELKINVGEFTGNKGTLFVASNGTNYAQIAFKNLGIYDNQILSKDDCIKAYNYLQTLKAK